MARRRALPGLVPLYLGLAVWPWGVSLHFPGPQLSHLESEEWV